MPLPPLAARERLLARFASLSALGCALCGLFCAVWPRLVFRAFALGGPGTSSAGMRLFGAIGGAALLGVAASARRASLRPREERLAFHPLLLLFGSGALFGLISLWRARGPGVPAAATLPLEVFALASALLFALAATLFVRGAPGVNVGPPRTLSSAEAAASKPVGLGVKPAPIAPAAATATASPATEPAPAQAASPAPR